MSDTEVLARVQCILDERRPAEEMIRAIRRLLEPAPEPQPIERNHRGWPVLRASSMPAAPWSRYDDPEMP
ncbi:hypothetical protein GCM10027269_15880 [Kribbella endophytica]